MRCQVLLLTLLAIFLGAIAKGPYNGACYKDTHQRKLLQGKAIRNLNPNSPDICKSICQIEEFKHAGVEAGTNCYCGNHVFRKHHRRVTKKHCRTPCKGNPEEFCGGKKNRKGRQKLFMDIYSSNPCRHGWTHLLNGCYRFLPVRGDAMTIEEANDFCSREGGYLAEVDDQSEQDALHKLYQDQGIENWVWLGGRYQDGQWIWTHSEKNITFTAWASGKPSDEGNKNCLAAWHQFEWANIGCEFVYTGHKALCEYDLCPEGWTYFETGCYRFLPEDDDAHTLGEAIEACQNEEGFLVEINNQYEQDALYQFYQDMNMTNWTWIGGSYKDGEWIWRNSGRKMVYTAWASGEPNHGWDKNCAVAWQDFEWANIKCLTDWPYYDGHKALCEHPGKHCGGNCAKDYHCGPSCPVCILMGASGYCAKSAEHAPEDSDRITIQNNLDTAIKGVVSLDANCPQDPHIHYAIKAGGSKDVSYDSNCIITQISATPSVENAVPCTPLPSPSRNQIYVNKIPTDPFCKVTE